jgi:FAD dependent oxidoreductase
VTLTRRSFVSLAAAATAVVGCSTAFAPPTKRGTAFDVVILGATPSGIVAAQAAVREGASVCIIEQSMHVGGILSSGLSVADTKRPQDMGGLAAQFFSDVGRHYGKSRPMYNWEPHAAEAIFNNYLDAAEVTVVLGCTLDSISVQGGRIERIGISDGSYVQGSQWIDATYEGDLMATAGVSCTVGREAVSQYGESLAGYQVTAVLPVSPYRNDGQLIPEIHASASNTVPGHADAKVMAYTFRAVLSVAADRLPFPQPPGYDPSDWLGVSRCISYYGITTHRYLMSGQQAGVKNKYCMENSMYLSSDAPGLGRWLYPVTSWPDRLRNLREHGNFVQGFLYFLSNDPSVPASVRKDFQRFGLPPDEFRSNGNWPYQMYIREGRRMIGQYVMTQADVSADSTYPDSVGIGQWVIDCHNCDFNAYESQGTTMIACDGGMSCDTPPLPRHQLPFRSILPTEVTNLAVPVCLSASHIGFSALRVEPNYMILGEAAGTAAGLGVKSGVDLSQVSVSALQARLLRFGGILS